MENDVKWHTAKIFKDTGGPVDLHAKLVAKGYLITLPAVRAWLRRDRIPAEWIVRITLVTGLDPRDWMVEDIF